MLIGWPCYLMLHVNPTLRSKRSKSLRLESALRGAAKLVTDIHAWLADILRALASRLSKASVQKHERLRPRTGLRSSCRDSMMTDAPVLLIDGARGSSKTTVLLSLRMWALALSENFR